MPRLITTDRLVLRSYAVADARRLAELISVPAVQQWLPKVPHPYVVDDAHQFIGSAQDDPWKLAITLEDDLIGGIAIAEQFGYWLGEPFWGRGYATEASRQMLAAWFAHNDGPVASGHIEGNLASRNVLLKLGFVDAEKGDTRSNYLSEIVALQHMTLCSSAWRAAA